MKPTVIIGGQWGDEGKGKLVDVLAKDFDVCGRFNGGNNAGHTIVYDGEPVKLHILPSGIFQKKQLLISQGAVFDPEVLLAELQFCQKKNLNLKLMIDYRVNMVMPYHKLMDGANELWKGKNATGSVKVGIGYCYEDRNNRSGIRVEDLFYPKILREKLVRLLPLKKAILEKVYGVKTDLNVDQIFERIKYLAKFIKPYAGDVSDYVIKNINTKKMLFEGAMASMLDASFGTYPYTVANNTISNSLFTSLGIPAVPINTIGVIKAYVTRVGGGPFPTEQKNSFGKKLQTIGHEIGATSGRVRRCGFLDLVALKFAHKLNNFSSLAVIKLDVMSTFTKIPVCTSYKKGTKTIKDFPNITHEFVKCRPVYQNLSGWNCQINNIKTYQKLPHKVQKYIEFIENKVNVPVKYISVGPERSIILKK